MIKLFRKIRFDMLKKKDFLKYLLYAIGEITLIVIGIMLALYFQNRNEEEKIEESINTSINMLKDEILTNKKMIDNVKDYHIMVRDTLKSMREPEKKEDIDNALGFWRGMRTPRLQNAAFQTSIQSGIGKAFNPELLKTLNSLYTYQESYNEFTGQTAQIFFNSDLTDFTQFNKIMTSVGMAMNDLYWYERELTEMLDYSIKQIDSITKKSEH